MTAFAQIATAVRDALLATPALAGGRVSLPLRRPVPPEYETYIEVRVAASQGVTAYAGRAAPTTWESVLHIDVYARATASATADEAIDALLAAVHARVQSGSWGGLGVTTMGLNPRVDYDWQDGDTPQAHVTYQATVQHDTASASLSPT